MFSDVHHVDVRHRADNTPMEALNEAFRCLGDDPRFGPVEEYPKHHGFVDGLLRGVVRGAIPQHFLAQAPDVLVGKKYPSFDFVLVVEGVVNKCAYVDVGVYYCDVFCWSDEDGRESDRVRP